MTYLIIIIYNSDFCIPFMGVPHDPNNSVGAAPMWRYAVNQ